jgi:putative ABC transport system substrate-binding protein
MKRRDFITLLLGVAVAWPVAARAQQQPLPLIGFLSATSSSDQANAPQFDQGLKETGYIEGQNVAIIYRWANGQFDQLPALAADLVRRKVSVIYASLSPATRAAKMATTTIPIVFATGADPVRGGLVASMNRPGGNVTGVSFYTETLGLKRLQLLRELVRQADTIAFLVNPAIPLAAEDVEDMQGAAGSIGQRISILRASTAQEIDAAFARAAEQHIGGILVNADPFFANQHDQLVRLAARYRIPSSYFNRAFVAAGGLMSYSDNRRESLRQASVYVGRILRGEKPGDLPVMQPTKFELVVNLTTAKALGLTVPPTLLVAADEVIE